MAASSFNTMVLSIVEHDALNAAAMRLQSATVRFTSADVIREANGLLPKTKDGEAIRLFFSTRHQTQDDSFDSTKDMGYFILERAKHIDAMRERHPLESKWDRMRSDLVEGYSYVIEAAHSLVHRGMIATRRIPELQAMIEVSDAPMAPFEAKLLEEAGAFYKVRKKDEADDTQRGDAPGSA